MQTFRAVLLQFGVVLTVTAIAVQPAPPAATGSVIDAVTGKPVRGAIVTIGDSATDTDEHGAFRLAPRGSGTVRVRAHGYRRAEVATASVARASQVLLTPVQPKALYLSHYGVGSRALREAALDLIDRTELNAVVIDVKGDRGLVSYRSALPLVARAGAQRVITIPDLPGLLAALRHRGIYTVARIVVFKDDVLATARTDLAIRRQDGTIYRDREDLAWTDPFRAEVRRYNIDVAREVALAGFDEVQFDYVRVPDARGLAYGVPDTAANRVGVVNGFLREAREALVPVNVFLAADIFGYVCWNTTDTGIGQQLESLAESVDYTSPMLYPSSFQFGIPGYRNPVQHPKAIVGLSLERALARTELPAVRFRPWLQAFADYAFGGQAFGAAEIGAQIAAAEEAGTNGWMLWNPRNRYSAAGLKPALRGRAD